jgi:hypothetical protein
MWSRSSLAEVGWVNGYKSDRTKSIRRDTEIVLADNLVYGFVERYSC